MRTTALAVILVGANVVYRVVPLMYRWGEAGHRF
jgi:hypothetical protein